MEISTVIRAQTPTGMATQAESIIRHHHLIVPNENPLTFR
jgi:hypothetical protein